MAVLKSLTNLDYSDRELLHLVDDHAGDDGWADSKDIAEALALSHKHRNQCVGMRFAYMKRHKLLDRHPHQRKWRLTKLGRALMNGKLSARQRESLAKLEDSDLILVQRFLGERKREAGAGASVMLRREAQRGVLLANGRRR